MALLGMQDVSIAFGGPPILDRANFAIERGERVCLLGRNGAGKSTIMKLLDGTMLPDSGDVVRQTGVTVTRLEQEVPDDVDGHDLRRRRRRTRRAPGDCSRATTTRATASRIDGSDAALRELDRLHHALDAAERVGDADARRHGAVAPRPRRRRAVRRRVGRTEATDAARPRARAPARRPAARRADEPSRRRRDRVDGGFPHRSRRDAAVRHARPRISAPRRDAHRRARSRPARRLGRRLRHVSRAQGSRRSPPKRREWAEFDKKLAKEEVWIRTGIQARRTRNEGRVRALEALRVERGARRERTGTVKLQAQEAERSGQARRRGARRELRVRRPRDRARLHARRSRAAIASASSDRTAPARRRCSVSCSASSRRTSGTIRLGTGLEIAYFDQLREQLDPERSVFDSIADGADFIDVARQRGNTCTAICRIFSFRPIARARRCARCPAASEIGCCSRGCSRARSTCSCSTSRRTISTSRRSICSRSCCSSSRGTLLVVSHDRAFLDNVVTSTLVFEGGGRVGEYVGGYTDWVRQRKADEPPSAARRSEVARRPSPLALSRKSASSPSRRRPSSRRCPTASTRWNGSASALCVALRSRVSPRRRGGHRSAKLGSRRSSVELEQLIARWEELETIAADGVSLRARASAPSAAPSSTR